MLSDFVLKFQIDLFDAVNATTIATDIGCEEFLQIAVNSTGCTNFIKQSCTVRAACVILSRLIVTVRYDACRRFPANYFYMDESVHLFIYVDLGKYSSPMVGKRSYFWQE